MKLSVVQASVWVHSDSLFRQYDVCFQAQTINAVITRADAVPSAGRRWRHDAVQSLIAQAMARYSPICGTYVKRSATGVLPTWTSPMTGTRVPTNQNQPTAA